LELTHRWALFLVGVCFAGDLFFLGRGNGAGSPVKREDTQNSENFDVLTGLMSTCGNNASNESVVNKWDRVENGGKVLVCLSVRCKIVEETDEGALLLDGTAVQRIVYSSDAPDERPQESIGFTMKQKGPTKTQLASGGEPSWELRQGIGRLFEQKFALQKCPLENFEHSHS